MKTIEDEQVAIMMATYNGANFIREQLDSIVEQTYANWKLFVRDDGSTDETMSILEEYQQKSGGKIVILKELPGGGSANANFAVIWKWVKENEDFSYYMFCDQDDYWLEDKVKNSLDIMKMNEDVNKPFLIHTDLKVVDDNLNVICDSFAKYRNLNMNIQDLNHLLIQNNITGCTMLWNRTLNDMLYLDNKSVAMHDWWMSTVTSMFGTIIYIPTATILYRQHLENVVGATEVNSFGFIMKRLKNLEHVKHTLYIPQVQAKALLQVYKDVLDNDNRKILEKMSELRKKNKCKRIFTILKYHYLKQGMIQIIGEILFI
ncbi:MAG: glycosyltransferase family 2 protein [Hespellia sp.]|nr:glycosyltransferase family 2 protein [Hespellia sp.]